MSILSIESIENPLLNENRVAKSNAANANASKQNSLHSPQVSVNGLVSSWLQRSLSPANSGKIKIGDSNSSTEREADKAADIALRNHNSKKQQQLGGIEGKHNSKTRFSKPKSTTDGNGFALPVPLANSMGKSMGADFSEVRLHTNLQANRMSADLDARAFNFGSDIFFNQGEYNPNTKSGQHLIAHELAHVVQQTGQIQRKPKSQTTSYTQKGLSRADFERIMRETFGVKKIIDGTYEDQLMALAVPKTWVKKRPKWQAFSPGSSSPAYQAIIDGFHNFNRVFGGFPQVDQITFFRTDYDKSNHQLTPDPYSSAKFQNKRMQIFSHAFTSGLTIPISRSKRSGVYRNRPPAAIRLGGGENAAPVLGPAKKDILSTIVHHELGHGLKDVAQRQNYNSLPIPDPTMMHDFASEIGWLDDKLYDVGQRAVRVAIKKGETPPEKYRISSRNWSSSKWTEQPMSLYSVQGGDGEDFAEAVRAYIEAPKILRARSPRRYAFIHHRRHQWASRLEQIKRGGQHE